MLAIIELDYTAREIIKNLSMEARESLREVMSQMKLTPEDAKYQHYESEFLADLTTDGPYLLSLGIAFKIKRFKSCYRAEGSGYVGPRTHTQAPTTNIQVAIPNLLLWSVDEIEVREDACTDAIQSMLDEGWRILAICPPPAQRRPDYILGRARLPKV